MSSSSERSNIDRKQTVINTRMHVRFSTIRIIFTILAFVILAKTSDAKQQLQVKTPINREKIIRQKLQPNATVAEVRARCKQLKITDCSSSGDKLRFVVDLHEAFPGKVLPIPFYAKVDAATARRMFTRIMMGPSASDTEGYIYAFYKVDSKDSALRPNEYKIGRTTSLVEKRLAEWVSKCGEAIRAKRSWKTKWNTLAETLIHHDLKGRKMWMGQVPCTSKCRGMYHQEWFTGDFESIKEVVDYWVRYVNALQRGNAGRHYYLL